MNKCHYSRLLRSFCKPTIDFTARKDDLVTIQATKDMAFVGTISKPYHFSQLITAISDQVNAHIESTWQLMENTQKEALENTLQSFNSLADQIVEKDPMSPEKAMSIMENMRGHLDQHFLRSFKELLLDAVSTGDFD